MRLLYAWLYQTYRLKATALSAGLFLPTQCLMDVLMLKLCSFALRCSIGLLRGTLGKQPILLRVQSARLVRVYLVLTLCDLPLLPAFCGIGTRIWRDAVTAALRVRWNRLFFSLFRKALGIRRPRHFHSCQRRRIHHIMQFFCVQMGVNLPWWKRVRARGSPSASTYRPAHVGTSGLPPCAAVCAENIHNHQTGTFQLMAYDLLHTARAQAAAGAA